MSLGRQQLYSVVQELMVMRAGSKEAAGDDEHSLGTTVSKQLVRMEMMDMSS